MDVGEPKRDDVFVCLQIRNNNNKKAQKLKTCSAKRERFPIYALALTVSLQTAVTST